MKFLIIFLLPIFLFAQGKENPDTVFTKHGLFPCTITHLGKAIVKVQYSNKNTSSIALIGINRISLDILGIVYANEKYKISLEKIQQFIQRRNTENNIVVSTSYGPLYDSEEQQTYNHQSLRIELGLGGGFAGEGGGLSGHFALAYMGVQFGGLVRIYGQEGAEGKTHQSWLFGSVTPQESFNDMAILGSFAINQNKSNRTILSIGYGEVSGRQLDSEKNRTKAIDHISGLAFEFGLASTVRTPGYHISLIGNINPEASIIAAVFSITVGYDK